MKTAPVEQERHGSLQEFLQLVGGLSVAEIARTLRCCTRTIRNYLAERSPIPWHRIEVLRMLAARTEPKPEQIATPTNGDEAPAIPNIDPDPAAPDVTPEDMLAWVGVHAPQFLSSRRSFALYVRGWNVIEKIRRARREGGFAAVLSRWRELMRDLTPVIRWRSGPLFDDAGPPAYWTAAGGAG
jgi:hypothetical protein